MASFITGLLSLLCMGAFGAFMLYVILAAVMRASGTVLGRGIVLNVTAQPSSTGGQGLSRYEVRIVRMDIEVPGQRPFEVNTQATIPARFVQDVLPGATVAVMVNPKSPGTVQVIGPGMAVPAFSIATTGAQRSGK